MVLPQKKVESEIFIANTFLRKLQVADPNSFSIKVPSLIAQLKIGKLNVKNVLIIFKSENLGS